MKKCSMCQIEKPKSEFAKSTAARDRLQRGCRECKAAQYQRNKGEYVKSSRLRRIERYNKLAKIKDKPCLDCGRSYPPYVMEFDHIADNKIQSIAWMLQNSAWQTILDEIKKCELVCSNCHKERTYKRLIDSGKACKYAVDTGESI